MVEVEQKFPADDLQQVADLLLQLDAEQLDEIEQVDVYFAHPCRDFADTDEAVRIRSVGDRRCMTYKGPKLDATTKTRREIEMPLANDPQSGRLCEQILLALGFERVAAVHKRRKVFRLQHEATPVEAVLDDVAGVGRFVELEVLCPDADEPGANDAQLDLARDVIGQLAAKLNLSTTERRSYLEMLLANQASPATGHS